MKIFGKITFMVFIVAVACNSEVSASNGIELFSN